MTTAPHQFCMHAIALMCWAATTVGATPLFSTGIVAGVVMIPSLDEASGLAASRGNPRVLWAHNDSGDSARVFAITEEGALLRRYALPGVVAVDFEDMACGPGPDRGVTYLYIGDIGDNASLRPHISVYRAPEPPVYMQFTNAPVTRSLTNLAALTCVYPGSARDAEALLVDPVTTSIFIASKQNTTRVYEAPFAAWSTPGVCTLELVFATTIISNVTAGDISPDGALIVLRAKDMACAWQRQPGEQVAAALERDPFMLPLQSEPQGETFAFSADNSCYFTLGEGTNQPLYRYDRADALRAEALLAPGSLWRWRPADASIGSAWRQPHYDDSAWQIGPAALGSNYNFLATTLRAPSRYAWTTLWFRAAVAPVPALYTSACVRAIFDDGCALYLNGTEVLRVNLASNEAPHTLAQTFYGVRGATWHCAPLALHHLNSATCVFAAEVHQAAGAAGFASLLFDAQCEVQPVIPESYGCIMLMALALLLAHGAHNLCSPPVPPPAA